MKLKNLNLKKSIKKLVPLTTILGGVLLAACSEVDSNTPTNKFELTSTSVNENNILKTTSWGYNGKSPELKWNKVPDAKAYAIFIIDKDASSQYGVAFFNWLAVVNDENTTELPAGASASSDATMKAKLLQFNNTFIKTSETSVIPSELQSWGNATPATDSTNSTTPKVLAAAEIKVVQSDATETTSESKASEGDTTNDAKTETSSETPSESKFKTDKYRGPTPTDRDHLYEVKIVALSNKVTIPSNTQEADQTLPLMQNLVAQAGVIKQTSLFFVGRKAKKENETYSQVADTENTQKIANGKFFVQSTDVANWISGVTVEGVTTTPLPPRMSDTFVNILTQKDATAAATEKNKQPETETGKNDASASASLEENNSVDSETPEPDSSSGGSSDTQPAENTPSEVPSSEESATKSSAKALLADSEAKPQYQYNYVNSPKVTWNRVSNAKSYVLMLNNSNNHQALGAAVVNWTVYGIKQPISGNTVTLDTGASRNTTKLAGALETYNSYYNETLKTGTTQKSLLTNYLEGQLTTPANSVSHTSGETNNQTTSNVDFGKGYINAYDTATTKDAGFYTLFIYATNLESTDYGTLNTQGDVMQKINNHVLARAEFNFKLAKTATTVTTKQNT